MADEIRKLEARADELVRGFEENKPYSVGKKFAELSRLLRDVIRHLEETGHA